MKRIALLVAAAFISGLFISPMQSPAYAKEYKIGYVDLMRIFDEYKKTKEYEKKLEEKAKAKTTEEKVMLDELRKLKDEQSLLSEKLKAEKQAIIESRIIAINDFRKKTQEELFKDRNDLLGTIMKEIENVVTSYAKEAGYDMVLNSRAMLYGAEQYDLTAEIGRAHV